MFFNLGLGEIAAILVLGLLIFGPDRLPRAVQTVVNGLRRFRSAADDATRTFTDAAGIDAGEARRSLSELADLHPRRLAGSVLEDRGADRPRNGERRAVPRGATAPAGAAAEERPARPLVDFDPDAP